MTIDPWFDEARRSAREGEELEDALQRADYWNPSTPGEELQCTVLKADFLQTRKYKTWMPVLWVEDLVATQRWPLGPDGLETSETTTVPKIWNIWANHKVLSSEIMSAMPAVGSKVLIEFVGKVPNRAGSREFYKYHVLAQRQDVELWQALSAARPETEERPEITPTEAANPDLAPF